MIVIGADTHKRTHALAAVDAGTGRVRGSREIKADEAGHLAAVRVGARAGRRAGVGDRGLPAGLAPPGAGADGRRRAGRSGRAASDGRRHGAASASPASPMRSTRSRSPARSSRTGSSGSRPRIWTSRRWRSGCSPITATISSSSARGCSQPAALASARARPRARAIAQARLADADPPLDRVDRRLRRLPRALGCGSRASRSRSCAASPARSTRSRASSRACERPSTALLAEIGCGALTAAILIGRTAGAQRFRSDASFALQSGTAPIPCSSGQRHQHRLNRGGDRQLNHALHIIAITRAQPRPRHQGVPRLAKKPRARPPKARCGASSATSPDASTTSSPSQRPISSEPPSTRTATASRPHQWSASPKRDPAGDTQIARWA